MGPIGLWGARFTPSRVSDFLTNLRSYEGEQSSPPCIFQTRPEWHQLKKNKKTASPRTRAAQEAQMTRLSSPKAANPVPSRSPSAGTAASRSPGSR